MSTTMDRDTKRKSIKQFRSLTQYAECEKKSNEIMVKYQIDGEEFEGSITDPFEIAEVLKDLNKIDHYFPTPKGVLMQRTKFTVKYGPKGQPVMYGIARTIKLSDVEFSIEDAITIAAMDYYNKAVAKMEPHQTAKLIYMKETVVKRIA